MAPTKWHFDFEHICNKYGVPAKRNARIKFRSELGKIVSARGHQLIIRMDSGERHYVHPTWEMEYL